MWHHHDGMKRERLSKERAQRHFGEKVKVRGDALLRGEGGDSSVWPHDTLAPVDACT